jgi:hypothetical protein
MPSAAPVQDQSPAQTTDRRVTVLVVTVLAFAATWLFRWLTLDFTNDHFVHLSRARQMLLGEFPVRDFFDPGLPLHYVASAAALAVWGQNLLGEAILTTSLVALGSALVFYLSARGSRSVTLACVATAVAVATFPRLYNYPKTILYPLALFCIWRYASRRSSAWLAGLATVTAVAFLFRHDHGVYIGLSAVVALVLANARQWRAVPALLTRFVLVTAVLLLPFFAYIQATTGVLHYFTSSASQSRAATTLRLVRLPVSLDTTAPWFTIDPPSHPRISIRWQPDVPGHVRREREQRYGLADPKDDGSYVLTNDRRDNISALVNDPLVADTHNIDRATLQPTRQESWLQRVRNRVPLLRIRLASDWLTPGNALAWLYYLTVLLPVVSLVVILVGWWRGTLTGFELATLGPAIVMCVVIDQGLLRESPDSRLPDVIGPTVVLGAWTTAAAFRRSAMRTAVPIWRTSISTGIGVVVAAAWLVTLWSATVLGNTGERVAASGMFAGPAATMTRTREVMRVADGRPIDWYAPEGSAGVRALTRYVLDCTRVSDRLLVTWFEPQIVFYAERPFAGGQVYLHPGWHSSTDDQLLTVARLRAQRVPIVLTNASLEREFHENFPLVHQFVQQHYVEAARSPFGADREYAVFVKRTLQPRRTYEPLNLPCFR